MAKTTFSVKLEFTDISANTPQEAVNTILKWIKEGVNEMIFDVQDETTQDKYTVDLSEDEDNQVLPVDVKVIDEIKTIQEALSWLNKHVCEIEKSNNPEFSWFLPNEMCSDDDYNQECGTHLTDKDVIDLANELSCGK